MRYAVIMAGGTGKRLWPLSRKDRPKQLLRLFEGKSLLDLAIGRLEGTIPPERILLVTNRAYVEPVARQHPELNRENLLGEPEGRDTANAIGLAAAVLARRDPDAIMGVFTADQIISPADVFTHAVRTAFEQVERRPDALVTFGVTPTSPHTGYGYIETGEELDRQVHRVLRFHEKPREETARQYLDAGNFFWNAGLFVWRAETILAALKAHLPDSHSGLEKIMQAWPNGPERALDEFFPFLPPISIDFAVMEPVSRTGRVLMVELPCQWMDVGSWTSLARAIGQDTDGNTVSAGRTHLVHTRDCTVISEGEHLLVLFGVEDLVVASSPKATLVMQRGRDQDLKEIVGQIKELFGEEHV